MYIIFCSIQVTAPACTFRYGILTTRASLPGRLQTGWPKAKAYLKFALLYGVPYLNPSPTHACMYTQFLVNSFQALTTIKNYLSGAKTWIAEHMGNPSAFSSNEALSLERGFVKKSQHVPSRAQPLFWHHVRHIIDLLTLFQLYLYPLNPAS